MDAAAGSSERSVKNSTVIELEGDRTLVMSRLFNGPPRIVFEAWTRPELVARWWAPASLGTKIDSVTADVRVGGKYRYALRTPDGNEVAFSGEYTEVTPPKRLVYTSRFEPYPDTVITTVTFEDRGNQTLLVSREVYPSAEVRKLAVESGMETGMRECMEQIETLVAELVAKV